MSDLERDPRAFLEAHLASCDECETAPLQLDLVAAALEADRGILDPAVLSSRVAAALQPIMSRRAQAAFRRRVVWGVSLSLLPLPAVLVYNAYFLSWVYAAASTLLPQTLAAYLVLSYAATLLLLFALTYAAIPLLVHGQQRDEAWST